MQRESKKAKSPVTIAAKPEKVISSKVSQQAKPVAAKKQPVIVADKITKKSKTTIPTPLAVTLPKNKKTTSPAQPSKQLKEKLTAAVSAQKSPPKTVVIKPEIARPKTKAKNIEAIISPIVPKPIKKKVKPIGSAVVRGKSGRYDFEVFPLDADLKDGSAIYVISKRVTDKQGKGHHKFVCIGQTESLLGDLKKHQKDKCIKQHKANVICLLREEDEKNRLKIETDLREAHTIICNQK